LTLGVKRLTENIKQKLLVFERRLLRRIFGPTQKTNGEWRQKTNEDLENLINHENIVRHIKSKRLSWAMLKECLMKEKLKAFMNGNHTQQDRNEGQY